MNDSGCQHKTPARAKFDLQATLKAGGARDCPRMGGMEDDRFYYRFVGNDVQLGVKSNFDRWANSVDFVFAPPKTLKAYEKLKARIDAAMLQFKPSLGQEIRLNGGRVKVRLAKEG